MSKQVHVHIFGTSTVAIEVPVVYFSRRSVFCKLLARCSNITKEFFFATCIIYAPFVTCAWSDLTKTIGISLRCVIDFERWLFPNVQLCEFGTNGLDLESRSVLFLFSFRSSGTQASKDSVLCGGLPHA